MSNVIALYYLSIFDKNHDTYYQYFLYLSIANEVVSCFLHNYPVSDLILSIMRQYTKQRELGASFAYTAGSSESCDVLTDDHNLFYVNTLSRI